MNRNGLFVHQLAVPRRGSDWHILWYSVIFHATSIARIYRKRRRVRDAAPYMGVWEFYFALGFVVSAFISSCLCGIARASDTGLWSLLTNACPVSATSSSASS